ncbi:MAG: GTPase domain-containing protein, partial [bacterium]|nr:GTPase domain-containing protein [bacterium]
DRTYFRVTLPIHEKYRELSSGKPPEQRQWTARDNNYIFIFGSVGVGKSTILARLAKALFDNYLVFMNPDKRVSNRLLQHWLQAVNNSKFPPRSQVGNIFDIEIGIKNPKEQKNPTNLNFLETSGEDLEKLRYMGEDEDDFSRELTQYLQKAGIFLVVTSFEDAANDDLLVWSFFNRLMNDGIDMSKLILVISKWDLNTEGLELDAFVKNRMPQTYKWLSFLSWGKMNLLPFSIGKVENNELKSLELKDSRLLV